MNQVAADAAFLSDIEYPSLLQGFIMKQELQEILATFAISILETYNLSFIPTDSRFLDAAAVAKRLGGTVVMYEYPIEVSVCRNRDSFIAFIPEEKEKQQQAKHMAEAVAILFLKMGYQSNQETFEKLKDLEKITVKTKTGENKTLYEELKLLKNELLLPRRQLRDLVKTYADENQYIRIADLSKELGFSYNFIEMRLMQTGMIQSQWL